MDFLNYFSQAQGTLQVMSRTANRKLDFTASKNKKARMIDGLDEDLALKLVKRNFRRVYIYVYQNRNLPIQSSHDARKLVENIAKVMNKDLVKENYLYRIDNSEKYFYTLVEDLPLAIEEFYERFSIGLNFAQDPVYMAAMAEWYIDLRDHFFVDGCGKIARAVSAWALIRAGLPLPDLTFAGHYSPEAAKRKYYAHNPDFRRLENQIQDDKFFFNFYKYYKTLIN